FGRTIIYNVFLAGIKKEIVYDGNIVITFTNRNTSFFSLSNCGFYGVFWEVYPSMICEWFMYV
ncbi:hypothetical protein ACJX0J_009038, partial [Zea mays]